MNTGKPDNKPYDTAFKDLAEQDPEALLRLIGALPEGATIRPLPREMTAPALFTDQPYEVTHGAEKFVAHVEAQTYYEDDVPSRTVKYDAILWINTGLPVRSYILVLSPHKMPANAPTEITVDAGGLVLTVRFHLVKLWELDAQQALAMNSESLLPFIPLMNGSRPLMNGSRNDAIQSTRGISKVVDELRRRELALHFYMLGSLRYPAADVLEMIERYGMVPLHKLKESPGYQNILGEGIEIGIEKGRQVMEKVLLDKIEMQFPGFDLKSDLDRVTDLQALEQLYFSISQFADAEELRAKVNELAIKN